MLKSALKLDMETIALRAIMVVMIKAIIELVGSLE